VILDISDKAHPRALFVGGFDPPASVGFTHTALPLFSRKLLIVSSEATTDSCAEATKRVWIWDNASEGSPRPIFPSRCPPTPTASAWQADASAPTTSGRTAPAHSPSTPSGWSWKLLQRRCPPLRHLRPAPPAELASFTPPAPPDSPSGTIQINHVYWDERGVGYAVDRLGGGLYSFQIDVPPALTDASHCTSG